MYTAVSLKDEQASIFKELVSQRNSDAIPLFDTLAQERIIQYNLLALDQLLLSAIKIILDIQALQEFDDGILVDVLLLLDDLDELLKHVPSPLIDNNCSSKVPQKMGSVGLDSIQVPVLEEEVDDPVPSILMVEEDEEAPVHQPYPAVELVDRRRGEAAGVNHLLEPVELLLRDIPVLHQYLRRKLAPEGAEAPLAVGAESTVLGQEISGIGVHPALILELGVLVERLDLVRADVVALLEHVEVVLLVGVELLHELRAGEEGDDGRDRLLEGPEPLDDLGAAGDHVGGDFVGAVERLVDVHGVVDHVGAAEEADLAPQDFLVGVDPALLEELQHGQDQMGVHPRRHARRQVVLRHGCLGRGDARVCGRRRRVEREEEEEEERERDRVMDDEAMRGRGEEEVAEGRERKDAGATTKKVPFFGMFRYASRADFALMGVGTVAAMVNGVSEPLMTVVFAAVIESFGGSDNSAVLHRVSKVVMYYIYLGIGTAIASFLQVSCWTVAGERQSARIRSLYLEAVLKQDVSFFDVEMTTGEAISRMSADTVLVQDALGEKVGKYAQLLTTFVGGFVIGFIRGWMLALVMLACIPPSILSFATVSRLRAQISARRQASYDDAGNVVEQSIGAIRTVVSFNGEKKAIALYNALIKKSYKATVLEGLVTGLGIGCIFCVVFCNYSLAFWYGAKLIISKGYTGGQVINVVFAILTGSVAIGNASPSISAIAEGQSAAHRLFEIINRKPKIDISDTSGIVLDDIKGDVELNNVFFRYPARPEQLILNGLSLQVPSGTTMAIVGESGSGKSTLISLVERFYDPEAGEVLIDGINIKSLKLQWIRGKMSLVSQEPLLFMTSIKDNITYGKEDATLEEIKRAAGLANAANFIEKLPNAYETMVGQSGAQLSGGQKQRIAIARAILRSPKVLLLDEATSALDVESERVVQEALNRIMVGITTLIVAHRLSTVRNADCIAVVHRGKVVEQGTHDQLIKDPDGAYCQLIQLQQVHTEGTHEVPYASGSRLKSRSLSLEQSMRDSPRNRRQQSIKSLGLPDSDNLHGHANTSTQDHKEFDDSKVPKKAPIGRLFNLNKPEAPILLLAVIAAFVHGLLFPSFSIMMSGGIRTFYYPAQKLRKDSAFWALLCLLLGIISLIAIQLEFFLFGMAGGKLVERVRALSFQSIMHQEVAWFDDPSNSR